MKREPIDPKLLRTAESILAQIKQRRFVDVINQKGKADHIYHKHFVSVAGGERGDKYFIGVQTYMFEYLLPIQFDTEPEMQAFLSDVVKAYR